MSEVQKVDYETPLEDVISSLEAHMMEAKIAHISQKDKLDKLSLEGLDLLTFLLELPPVRSFKIEEEESKFDITTVRDTLDKIVRMGGANQSPFKELSFGNGFGINWASYKAASEVKKYAYHIGLAMPEGGEYHSSHETSEDVVEFVFPSDKPTREICLDIIDFTYLSVEASCKYKIKRITRGMASLGLKTLGDFLEVHNKGGLK